jgi:hypothetical protein
MRGYVTNEEIATNKSADLTNLWFKDKIRINDKSTRGSDVPITRGKRIWNTLNSHATFHTRQLDPFITIKNTFHLHKTAVCILLRGALLCGCLVFGFLDFQDLLDNLLLFDQESTNDPAQHSCNSWDYKMANLWTITHNCISCFVCWPLPNSRSWKHSTIRTVHSPAVPRQPWPLVLRWPQVWNLKGEGNNINTQDEIFKLLSQKWVVSVTCQINTSK